MDGTVSKLRRNADAVQILFEGQAQPVWLYGTLARIAIDHVQVGDRVKLRRFDGNDLWCVADQLQTLGPVDDNGGRTWTTHNSTAAERESFRYSVGADELDAFLAKQAAG